MGFVLTLGLRKLKAGVIRNVHSKITVGESYAH